MNGESNGVLLLLSLLLIFEKIRVRILYNSTITLLNYFQDTLAYVGIPEYWLEWDLECVNKIGRGMLAPGVGSNWETLGQNKSWMMSQIKSKMASQIVSGTVTRTKLMMSMMAFALAIWHVNGRALVLTIMCVWWSWHWWRFWGRRRRRIHRL